MDTFVLKSVLSSSGFKQSLMACKVTEGLRVKLPRSTRWPGNWPALPNTGWKENPAIGSGRSF